MKGTKSKYVHVITPNEELFHVLYVIWAVYKKDMYFILHTVVM